MDNTFFYGYNIAQNSTELFDMRCLEKRPLPRGLYIKHLEEPNLDGEVKKMEDACFDICTAYEIILKVKNEIDDGTDFKWFLTSATQYLSIAYSKESGALIDAQYVLHEKNGIVILIDTETESFFGFVDGTCSYRCPYDEKMKQKLDEITQQVWENIRKNDYYNYKTHDLGDRRAIAYIK